MLCFDYLQPSIDGQPLAVVRYRPRPGQWMSAVALVRCPPEVVAQFPTRLARMKPYLKPYEVGQRRRTRFALFDDVTYAEWTWKEHGLEIIEFITLHGYTGQRESSHPDYHNAMRKLLGHPEWLATGEAWLLRDGLDPRAPAKARVRI